MKEIQLFCFLFIYSTVLAKLEIQIEGKNGWASALPCWKIKSRGWLLTGYHLWMNLFIILVLHFPLFFIQWNWRLECLVFGFLLASWELEDFLWFVLNPHYGLRGFKPEKIPWHQIWWGPLPNFYWWLPIIWGALLYFGLPALHS